MCGTVTDWAKLKQKNGRRAREQPVTRETEGGEVCVCVSGSVCTVPLYVPRIWGLPSHNLTTAATVLWPDCGPETEIGAFPVPESRRDSRFAMMSVVEQRKKRTLVLLECLFSPLQCREKGFWPQ